MICYNECIKYDNVFDTLQINLNAKVHICQMLNLLKTLNTSI